MCGFIATDFNLVSIYNSCGCGEGNSETSISRPLVIVGICGVSIVLH
jgi:hypothetical protein